MARVFPGRYTAQSGEPFVVFLIGMRINRLFALRKWTRVASAMPPMLAELKRDPSLGLLHAEIFFYWRGVATVQYWRSFDQLHAYAHARNAAHLPAWAEFNRRIGGNGAVGVWHETYTVSPGQYETVYVNMPRFGLAAAADHVPASGILETARSRIGRDGTRESKPDQAPSPGQNL
jgi:hypothetical protein